MTDRDAEILALTQQLLDSVAQRDWGTYAALCYPEMTCFEPEAAGTLVAGLEFHKFYFDTLEASGDRCTICSPVVHWMGEDAAAIAYVRLIQGEDTSRHGLMQRYEETRVWRRQDGRWQQVHFHRSGG